MRAWTRGAAWVALAFCALTLGACSRGGVAADSPTATSASAMPGGALTPSSNTPSPGVLIPTVDLADSLPAGLGPDPSHPTVPQATLVAILSEQLSDGGTNTVQTAVCSGDLPPGGTTGVTCTVTGQENGRSTDTAWVAYATHNPDGSPAVLWEQGDPLSAQFQGIIGGPGTASIAHAIGPAYGTDPIPAAQITQDAGDALAAAGSPVTLSRCTGTLSFASFGPVACEGTAGGTPQRVLVLPGAFLRSDPGLLIVTQPVG